MVRNLRSEIEQGLEEIPTLTPYWRQRFLERAYTPRNRRLRVPKRIANMFKSTPPEERYHHLAEILQSDREYIPLVNGLLKFLADRL